MVKYLQVEWIENMLFEIINKKEKISKNNKIQCVYKIDKIHKVYNDDYRNN